MIAADAPGTHGIRPVFERHGGCLCRRVPDGQRFVYILKSLRDPRRVYVGVTADLHARVEAHNAGDCVHTARYRPWMLDVVIAFADEPRALAFERYLKSGSGAAFTERYLR